MRKALIILFTLFAACKPATREEIAKKNIREYLSQTMHDYRSYEPVKFGKLDSGYLVFGMTDKYKEMRKRSDSLIAAAKEMINDARLEMYTNPNKSLEIIANARKVNNAAEDIETAIGDSLNHFKPVFRGYEIVHSFRGKNTYGATILSTERFYLDTNLNVVNAEKVEDKDK